MSATPAYIANLIFKRLNGELTATANAELNKLLSAYSEAFKQEIHDELLLIGELRNRVLRDESGIKAKTLERITPLLTFTTEEHSVPRMHRVHFFKTAWFRIAVAILLMAGISTYVWNNYQGKYYKTLLAKKQIPSKTILPGSNKAILTLSNGEQIELTADSTETIYDDSISINNHKGELLYSKNNIAVWNTMTTPRGGQYKLTLSDGSRVWLNAASSITFPSSFNNKNREISISGEAFFEIAKNPSKPFIVKTDREIIKVLGTSFNINNYPDEPITKTSLIEGSLKVGEQVLIPGQASTNGKIEKTNIDQDIAWKNGKFNFYKVPLVNALRQISRWYDLDLVFTKSPNTILWGTMSRDLELNQLLKLLSETGLKYELKGKILEIK
jgi:transmembrane sensor